MPMLQAAAAYSLLVFGAGFVLGTIRVLVMVPQVGERAAELMEMPLMLAVIVIAARWISRRFLDPNRPLTNLGVGLIAMGFVLAADLVVGVGLRGMSPGEALLHYDPVSGTVYYLSLLFFAGMPWWLSRLRQAKIVHAAGKQQPTRPDESNPHPGT